MSSYIVYRDIPGIPRQYVRRAVNSRTVLWHRDIAIAQRFDKRQATNWALVLNRRTETYAGHAATETPGHYDYEEVKPGNDD